MAMAFPDVALCYLVDNQIQALEVWIHLYMTDVALTSATTLADLVELDVSGYVPQVASGWTPATIQAGRAQTTADPLEFGRGSSGPARQVYGYFATDGVGGPLLWCERGDDAPYPMVDDADVVMVLPRYQLGPCGPRRLLVDLDAAGDLVAYTLPPAEPVYIDAAGDLVAELGPELGPLGIDAAGDLVAEVAPFVGPFVDTAGDLTAGVGPLLPVLDVDAGGDVES